MRRSSVPFLLLAPLALAAAGADQFQDGAIGPIGRGRVAKGELVYRVPTDGLGPVSRAPTRAELDSAPPPGYPAGAFGDPEPRYGFVRLGRVGRVHFVLFRGAPESTAWDRIAFDLDLDRDFADEQVFEGTWRHVPERGRDYLEFRHVPFEIRYSDAVTQPFAFTFYAWPAPGAPPEVLFVTSSSWREGSVRLEGRMFRVAVLDADNDAVFDRAAVLWNAVPEEEAATVTDPEGLRPGHVPVRVDGIPYGVGEINAEGTLLQVESQTEADARKAEQEHDRTLLEPPRARSERPIPWRHDLDAALAETAGRPVFLLFAVDWSREARRFEERTLHDAEVRDLLDDFVCVRVDPQADAAVGARFAVDACPTWLVLDGSGRTIERQVGYRPARSFAQTLRRLR